MDIHPLVVHFPIALLSVYSILEVIRTWTKQPFWKPLRAFLVLSGTLGAFLALQTGEAAEHAFRDSALRNVLAMHSFTANLTTFVYAVLAGSYIVMILSQKSFMQSLPPWAKNIVKLLINLARGIQSKPTAEILALVSVGLLGLVGALGGILVYGPDFDPVTKAVYSTFFGG